MKKSLILYILSIFVTTTSAQVTTNLYNNADKTGLNNWVDSVYMTLTIEEKIGQLFMPMAEPNSSWKTRIESYINNYKVGGILFSRGTLSQQADITNYAQGISKVPLLISLDGEWGLSMRLQDAPKYPRNQIIGAIGDDEIVKLYGKEIARQSKEMGIHINFAPVIDIHSNPKNPVIGTRAFGENPQNVANKGVAFAAGLEARHRAPGVRGQHAAAMAAVAGARLDGLAAAGAGTAAGLVDRGGGGGPHG